MNVIVDAWAHFINQRQGREQHATQIHLLKEPLQIRTWTHATHDNTQRLVPHTNNHIPNDIQHNNDDGKSKG